MFDFGSQQVFSFNGTRDKSRVSIRGNGTRKRFAPIPLGHRNTVSVTVQLDLPESVAAEARAKGLLDPQKLTQLVEREIELDKPMREFRQMVEQMRAYPDEPMTMDEIQAEVNAIRAERRARREGRR